MIDHLLRACDLVEHGSSVASLRQIVFSNGRLTAHNGILQYQAPSGLDKDEHFAVEEKKLALALRSCGEGLSISATKEFLRLSNGPLTVRVRKIIDETVTDHERIALPKSAATQKADELCAAIKRVQPFMSSDASRPWSVAVLIKDGFVWATNNLALVRTPIAFKGEMRIPAQTIDFLCSLPELGYYDIDSQNRIVFSTGKALVRSPQAVAEWPDVSNHFAKMPKKLPPAPEDMKEAARTVGKLSERFVDVNQKQVESKTEAIESEYEVAFAKGKGSYSAKLLTLILEHSTHIDFSFYPSPIFFRGDQLEGTAVGMKP